MPDFNRASKDKSGEKERHKRTAQRQKRKGAKMNRTACCSGEKSAITTQAGKRKRAQPPISTAPRNSFIAPWEGSSNSESSFTSIPPAPHFPSPPSPRHPPSNTPSKIVPNPPQANRNTNPDSRQSVLVKRRLIPSRGTSRPQHLPPLRHVSNLNFSRSFTFSFFELPWHQSVQNRADRLKELVLLLKKIQY
ncbi:hypothetical protein C0J45_15257 [Silurus meridionalis]|nr:hypothetical protein C0J45_15257 [Silurus meridionalis]